MQWVKSLDDGRMSRRSWTNLAFATLTIAVASLSMACGSDKPPATTGGNGGNAGSGSSSGGAGGAGGGAGGDGGAGGSVVEMPGPVEEVVKFDWIMGELGEGLAIDGTTAYVSFGSLKVVKVDLLTKTKTDFGTIAANLGEATPQGLALDAQKNLYVAVTSDPVKFKPGIYKFPQAGGAATLFAEHPNMSYPRGIAFAKTGEMVVASPPGARMFAVMPNGQVNDPGVAQVLSGDQGSACAYGENLPYGVSSVAFDGSSFYGTNADRGQVFSGALAQDMAGNIFAVPDMMAVFAGPDCTTLGGADGIVVDSLDPNGDSLFPKMYVAARDVNKIAKVEISGEVTVIADKTMLHEPSAMAMTAIDGDRYLYILNSARTTFNSGGVPGLVRIRLGKAK